MDAVFFYFVAIGSGLTFGVALVAFPIYGIFKRLQGKKRKGVTA